MTTTTSPLCLILMLIAFLAGIYGFVGQWSLQAWLAGRGIRIPWVLAGLPFYTANVYRLHRSSIGSRWLDVLVVSSLLSFAVCLLCFLLIFPLGFCADT